MRTRTKEISADPKIESTEKAIIKQYTPRSLFREMLLFNCPIVLIPTLIGDIWASILLSLGLFIIFLVGFMLISENPLRLKYKALKDKRNIENLKNHAMFYPQDTSKKQLFQRSILGQQVKGKFITYSLLVLLISLGVSSGFLILSIISFELLNIDGMYYIYSIIYIIGIIISTGFLIIFQKYRQIQNEFYSEKNNFFFLNLNEKCYYDSVINSKGGIDYFIY